MNTFDEFGHYLAEQGRGALTVAGYTQDLALYARWFEHTNGEPLTPAALTLTDAREYRQHLLGHKAKPATAPALALSQRDKRGASVNRHLAALKACAAWAAETGQVEGNPISGVRGAAEQKPAPRWLDRKAQGCLMRELEKTVTNAHTQPAKLKAARDLALVRLLLNTGLRVGELCALEIGDIPQLGERGGRLVVGEGKGCKRRELPLNADARKALRA